MIINKLQSGINEPIIKTMFNPAVPEEGVNYEKRREFVFIVLAGIFLGSLAMLNILGISRLLDFSFKVGNLLIPFKIFVGVLPYPVTFLCTDFISELYGKKRASMVVWTGLIINLWVLFIIWLGGILPPVPEINPPTGLPPVTSPDYTFFSIRRLTFGSTAASMIAYLTAQLVDVHVFHLVKRLTRAKYLWIRNNVSTLTSQLVDSFAVVLITYYFTQSITVEPGIPVYTFLIILILSNYVFKVVAALIDTIPFYYGTKMLAKYLNIDIYRGYIR